MDLAAYLGSVISVVVTALGAMYALTRQLRLGGVESRLARVEVRVDAFRDSLAEFGERLSRHERDHPQA